MPDLEERIAEWRKRMAAGGVKTPTVLDELESHLREEFEKRISDGDSEAVAFQTAAERIGSARALHSEFSRLSGAVSLPVLISASIWIGAVVLMLVLFSGRVAGGRMSVLLFMHVLTITSGYLAAFLAGALAICYVYYRWAGRLAPALQQALTLAVLRFTYISGGFNIAGFLLGMLWTHRYRGAMWLNDPREYGCLCVCVWFVAICLAQSLGKVSERSRMLLGIVGNMIVAQAWFGAGILAAVPDIYWYGAMNCLPLQLFMGAHLLFLLMAFSRKLETAET